MPDDDEIRTVAAEYIRQLGPRTVAWLNEQAEIADEIGDHDAAKTWREIAITAKQILLED